MNHQTSFKAVILDFMMELENVQSQGKKKPFGLDFFLAAKEKLAETQVFLDKK